MTSQTLIVYKFNSLYHVLTEISLDLNFKVLNIESEKLLNNEIKNLRNFLIISNQKNFNISNIGEVINIDSIKLIKGEVEVINFDVEPLDVYFAGGVLVHNKGSDSDPG